MGDKASFPMEGLGPLVPEPPARPSYDVRIQRAHSLTERFPASAELLGFYARLAFCQQGVFESLSADRAPDASFGAWPLVLDTVSPLFPDFARALAGISPSPLRERASQLAAAGAAVSGQLLENFWRGEFPNDAEGTERDKIADRFVALAFLQPYAEWLAKTGHSTSAPAHHATCPVCSAEPICAVLRDQDHGARRALVCSFCMNEWNFERLLCPSCGERRFELLPVYTPEGSHVRVDACDTCKHYLKTVDLTTDGLAVPVVDELAATSLDLWARGEGYVKLTTNVAGL